MREVGKKSREKIKLQTRTAIYSEREKMCVCVCDRGGGGGGGGRGKRKNIEGGNEMHTLRETPIELAVTNGIFFAKHAEVKPHGV